MLFYFVEIAKHELSHAMIFHDMALAEVNKAKDAGKSPRRLCKSYKRIRIQT